MSGKKRKTENNALQHGGGRAVTGAYGQGALRTLDQKRAMATIRSLRGGKPGPLSENPQHSARLKIEGCVRVGVAPAVLAQVGRRCEENVSTAFTDFSIADLFQPEPIDGHGGSLA